MVAHTIDLEHVRRSRRLLGILVDRFGVAHFLESRLEHRPEARGGARVDGRACEDAIALACAWIERRSGRAVADEVVGMMRRELRKVINSRIAAGVSCSR